MSYQLPFEKLEVWHLSRQLVKEVYCITKTFPKEEQYGLSSQIQRAVISVPSNIAEGTSRTSYKDQAHFTQVAFSSLMEVNCQLILAIDLDYLSSERYDKIKALCSKVANMLNALRKSQLRRSSDG
ncbi:four helix bundle protein [Algivirga pacifica]|uniref:Four helix bundle protein n=1 Tax=Algivirga pacifica TaxID=1162670 RepID=A0ABP9CYR4_9BACT